MPTSAIRSVSIGQACWQAVKMKSATQIFPASSRLPNGCPRWSVSRNAGKPPSTAGDAGSRRVIDR